MPSRACSASSARGRSTTDEIILVVCNFTPVPRHNYRVGVPRGGYLARDSQQRRQVYGGSGQGNLGGVAAAPMPWHGRPYLLNITTPPLGMVMFRAAVARSGLTRLKPPTSSMRFQMPRRRRDDQEVRDVVAFLQTLQ